ncbi:MAG: hypothetical protein WC464_04015 [Bdellovibrionales bacterium]
MIDPTDNEEEIARRKKKDEGEGDADSWGRGKAGAGAMAGKVRLPPQKLKEVMADWRHLDVLAVIEAVADFFSALPMRASANLSVAWQQTKSNAKSFAIVNWAIKYGEKAAKELKLSREKGAGRDTRGFQKDRNKRLRVTPGANMKPEGPSGQ